MRSRGGDEHQLEADDLKEFNFNFQGERDDSMISEGSGHNSSLYQLETP